MQSTRNQNIHTFNIRSQYTEHHDATKTHIQSIRNQNIHTPNMKSKHT